MITCSTYAKAHILDTPEKLDLFQKALFEKANAAKWELNAWAILSNHYHVVARVPEEESIPKVMRSLHGSTALALNRADGVRGRKVWNNYWQTLLSIETSYLARLAYVHQNPERHGVCKSSRDYKWCSMKWFEDGSEAAWFNTIMSFKTDFVNVLDDFDEPF